MVELLALNVAFVFAHKVFVWMVVVLTSSILLVAYIVLLPNALRTYSTAWLVWHLCYGHWNLVMIVFHYYKAVKTAPGQPPSVRLTHKLFLMMGLV